MRAEKKNAEFHVKAIAGTHVVLLAIKPVVDPPADFRGFAISRSAGGAAPIFLTGIKFFAGTEPNWKPGDAFSSYDQPIQSFFWSDYAASPGVEYQFKIIPRLGTPGSLRDGNALGITIRTEPPNDGKHGVWFNRGIVASHKFATEFQNKPLTTAMANDVKDGQLQDKEAAWLSRGLAEACLAYIDGSKRGEGLRVCAYEFTWLPIIQALKAALDRGVDVQIVYHAVDANQKAIDKAHLPATSNGKQILFKRTRPPIPHNKYIVKLVGGVPKQVWTGSTNFTDTGFLGQTNVGHLVTDDGVAKTYLAYWTELSANPVGSVAMAQAVKLTPNPPNLIAPNSISPFYSPRIADNMLDWYGERIKDSCALTMITLPFNVAPAILSALDQAKRSLRLAILENEPTRDIKEAELRNKGMLAFSNGAILGKTFVHEARGGAKVAPISQGKLDDWFVKEELARPTNAGHVFFLHSKILLVDPLSDDPLVCTGSANFSSNSLTSNDENMLLIRGEKRVADIYLTELDRIFKHFYDRDAINRQAAQGHTPEGLNLDTTSNWVTANDKEGSYKHNRLVTFFPEAESGCSWSKNARGDPDPFQDEQARADAKRQARKRGAGAATSARKTAATQQTKKRGKKATTKKAATKSSPKKPATKKAAAKKPVRKAATKRPAAKRR